MIEKINNTEASNETRLLVAELDKWKENQKIGEDSGDSEMVVNSIVHQIEYLNGLGQIDEARVFLDNMPNLIDLNQPHMREMITDAYVMIDDIDYFYNWYKQNLFQREANEGDQILIYALLCHNRNSEALEVFDKIFPVLTSVDHIKNSLRHIPKLIEDKSLREFYYRSILERSQNPAINSNGQNVQNKWSEISLQAQYSLNDIQGFEKTVHLIQETDPKYAQKHFDFLERLLDINNPKWKENKVFGIGLSKTGTSSLSKALSMLNFSTAHWTNPYSHDLITKEDVPLFDSLTDISISHQYKDLYEKYPEAKFVLTSRSVEKWEKSFLTHYARSMHSTSFDDLKKIITEQYPPRFGQRYIDMHHELYFKHNDLSDAYQAHEQDVLSFFQGRENQLLMLDVSKPNALQELSNFLGVDSPQSNFPHVNTKEEKTSWVSPISGVTRSFKFKK